MYVTEYCADCMRVKKYFETRGVRYLQVGLEGNERAAEFVMKVNRGFQSVPTIVFPDGSVLVEPDWEVLNTKFSES